MKKIISILTLVFLLSLAGKAQAQSKFKSEEDSINFIALQSTFYETAKKKYWKQAEPHWRKALTEYPGCSKYIYTTGEDIVEGLIEIAKKEGKKERLDSLVNDLIFVYDEQIKYFGDDRKQPEGYLLGKKGLIILKYHKQNVADAYDCLKRSIDMQKNSSKYSVLNSFMLATVGMYKAGQIDKAQVADNYLQALKITDYKLQKAENKGKKKHVEIAQTVLNNLDNLFTASGAADCDALIGVFSPKFEENPEDMELLRKIRALLEQAENCQDSKLYVDVLEQMHSLKPSASSAYGLAKFFKEKGQKDKAADYFLKAVELESDSLPKNKAEYYYQLAALKIEQKQAREAYNFALKSLEFNEEQGKPYLIIGIAYASSRGGCGETEFERKAVSWLAVDQFRIAKQKDPELEERANDLVRRYAAYPKKNDAFFHGFTEGQSYTINCGWIQGTTTVRF